MGIQVNIFDEVGSDYSLFESSYLYARDLMSYTDDDAKHVGIEENLSRINVWVISEEEMGAMIPKFLKPEELEFTFAIIMPDLEQPWDLMAHCEKWMKVLKDAVYSMSPKLNLRTLEKLKNRIVTLFKTYEEPELDKDGKLINKKITKKLNITDIDDSKGEGLDEFDQSLIEEQEMMDDVRNEIEL